MGKRLNNIVDTVSNKRLWASVLCGASLVFAYAPFSLWWLTLLVLPCWIYYVNYQVTQSTTPVKTATQHGFGFGFGWFGTGISWVHVSIAEFGGVPLVVSIALMILLCLYLALFPAAALYATAKISDKLKRPTLWWLLAPTWLLAEYLRSVFLTGFPWLSLGYSQMDSPLSILAPIIGEIGITFVITIFAVSLFYLSHKKVKLASAALSSILILIILGYNATWVTDTGKTTRIALVQGNIEQSIKWQPDQQWPTMLKYLDLSRVNYDADIIVWPESAVASIETLSTTQEFLDVANRSAALNNTAIITGIINYYFETERYFNALIVLGKKHAEDDEAAYYYNNKNRYYKNHLLPIGEFVPFGDLLRPLAPLFNLPMSSFTRGDYVQNNLLANGIRLLPLICFEIAFPAQLSANFTNQTNILLTVSNDAWFGNSHGPHQHMEIARMRSLEFGRPLVRSTNTGVTAMTNQYGEIVEILPQFEQGVIKADLPLVSGLTPYARWGDLPTYIFALLLTLTIIFTTICKNKKHLNSNS
ncbi:apolipoprotein N-acyltransferase [Thalassotalea marina]|uniref:Apolipoprotein N-acyltransferase n=1 Tax=Thalassotalea marina TaxID=1673741 RepID=A0A919BJI2_9GAMM|nr:apolipoprotein N-acyltransferase [Thalassotalea marina]GHF95680.1 apolipoprotein N-acyltransferase [Thalassotalea marina]